MKERERERKGKKKKMERERERDIVFYACWWDNNDADLYKKKIEREERKNATPFDPNSRWGRVGIDPMSV